MKGSIKRKIGCFPVPVQRTETCVPSPEESSKVVTSAVRASPDTRDT